MFVSRSFPLESDLNLCTQPSAQHLPCLTGAKPHNLQFRSHPLSSAPALSLEDLNHNPMPVTGHLRALGVPLAHFLSYILAGPFAPTLTVRKIGCAMCGCGFSGGSLVPSAFWENLLCRHCQVPRGTKHCYDILDLTLSPLGGSSFLLVNKGS